MSTWEYYTAPIILTPSPKDMRLLFAQSCIRQSIANEVEADADRYWQMMLRDDTLSQTSVEELEALANWWFRSGYSEFVHRRAKRIYIAEIVAILEAKCTNLSLPHRR